MKRGALLVALFALFGLVGATSIGFAAYLVTRDSVGVPATKLERASLAPSSASRKGHRAEPRPPRRGSHSGSDDSGKDRGEDD